MKEIRINEELNKRIKKIMPFRFMDAGPTDYLLERSAILHFEKGEYIIRQGEINQSFYSIIEGGINVTVSSDEGQDSYITAIGAGEVFGEAGIFLKVPRTANVVCSSDLLVVMIPRRSILKLIREFPENGNKFLMMIILSLLRKLKGSNQELAYERKDDAKQDEIDVLVKDLLG